jgi:transcriptional regulator of PTS gene
VPLREIPEERLSVSKVKHQSRRLVFKHIFQNTPVTRAAIATQTGLSQGTVKTIVDEFLESGIVKEQKDTTAPVGRKPQKVHLQPDSRMFGVLHLKPGRMEFHLLDLRLQPVDPSPAVLRPSGERYGEQLAQFLSGLPETRKSAISGVGVIVPGAYEPDTDRVSCHLMPELHDVAIRATVRAELPVPVAVGEDVHLAAFAEAGFPHNAEQPLFYLYAGQGVGGCYVSEGRILTGANGMAGEIGQVVTRSGSRLEELVNWPFFLKACGVPDPGERVIDSSNDGAEEIRQLLSDHNERAIAAVGTVVGLLSVALGSMVCIMNPRTILVGGPYGQLGDAFLEPLRSALTARLIPEHRDGLRIAAAQAGDHGMIRSAAFTALERWFEAEYSFGGYQ